MCLRMLERITRRRDTGWSMLDAGTGSGILAIAGSCLGANRIIAIDNLSVAQLSLQRKCRAANGIHNISPPHRRCSDAEVPGQVRHHHREPLQRDFDRGVAPVGRRSPAHFWMSDFPILRSQEPTITTALAQALLEVRETRLWRKMDRVARMCAGKQLTPGSAQSIFSSTRSRPRFPASTRLIFRAALGNPHAERRAFLRHCHAVLDAQDRARAASSPGSFPAPASIW